MHNSFKTLALAAGLLIQTTPPALACGPGMEELQLSLIGDWRVSNGFGTLSMGGRTIPLPSGNSTDAQIVASENGLAVTGGAAPGTFDMTFIEDARFVLDAPSQTILNQGEAWFDEKPSVVTSDELTVLADCAGGQMLPQIRVSGQFQDPEGVVKFDVFLFVLDERTMYGMMSGELLSIGGTAKRVTRWTR